MAATASSVVTAAIVDILAALIFFGIFDVLRRWRKTAKLYDCKTHTPDSKVKPAPVPKSFFGWINTTLNYSEPDVLRECGLDTAIFFRMMKFVLVLFSYVTFWCLLTVLPVNITDNEVERLNNKAGADYRFTDFDELSLANVQAGSHRMWMHIVSVYVLTSITLWKLWDYSRDVVKLRLMYLGSQRRTPLTHSVLVTDIPGIADATYRARAELKYREREFRRRGYSPGGARDTALIAPEDANNGPPEAAPPGLPPSIPASEDHLHLDFSSKEPSPPPEQPPPAAAVELLQDKEVRGMHRAQLGRFDLRLTSLLDPVATARSALASDRMTPYDLVYSEFCAVYSPEVVESVVLINDLTAIEPLVSEYEELKVELEDYVDECQYLISRGKLKTPRKIWIMLPKYGLWGREHYGHGLVSRVEALPFYITRLRELERRIAEERQRVSRLVWPAAFVTFRSRVAQAIASTTLHQHDERTWVTQPAPEPETVIWENLGMARHSRLVVSLLMWTLFWVMASFYMVPIGALQGLIDAASHAHEGTGLDKFLNNTVIRKLLEAIVPGLVLKIFLYLVPHIIGAMIRRSGAILESQVDLGTVNRYFIFQVIVVFFGAIVSGSFFSQATQWLQDPSSAVTLLGTAVPQTTTFFITFIWISAATAPLGFLNLWDLLLFWVQAGFTASPKARARMWQNQPTKYFRKVANQTIILFLGLIYSCINPVIAPTALAYFFVANIIERYENIFMFVHKHESGGALWVQFFNQAMTSLYVFQAVMIALISIKRFPYSVLIAPCLLLTIYFHYRATVLMYRPLTVMSLHDAALVDLHDKDLEDEEPREVPPSTEYFRPPSFKVRPGSAEELIQQAEALRRLPQFGGRQLSTAA